MHPKAVEMAMRSEKLHLQPGTSAKLCFKRFLLDHFRLDVALAHNVQSVNVHQLPDSMALSGHLPFRVRQSWGIVNLGNKWGSVVYAGKNFGYLIEIL